MMTELQFIDAADSISLQLEDGRIGREDAIRQWKAMGFDHAEAVAMANRVEKGE